MRIVLPIYVCLSEMPIGMFMKCSFEAAAHARFISEADKLLVVGFLNFILNCNSPIPKCHFIYYSSLYIVLYFIILYLMLL